LIASRSHIIVHCRSSSLGIAPISSQIATTLPSASFFTSYPGSRYHDAAKPMELYFLIGLLLSVENVGSEEE
jgi:hypothetical protein